MTAARILALGGTLASALTMIGGLAGSTLTVGLAGAVMFAANVAVLAGAGRFVSYPRSTVRFERLEEIGPRASASISNCVSAGDVTCVVVSSHDPQGAT